jgi:hypothetical protein
MDTADRFALIARLQTKQKAASNAAFHQTRAALLAAFLSPIAAVKSTSTPQ